MDFGIMYACIACVSMLVEIIIFNRVIRTCDNNNKQKPFAILLLFFIIFSLVDGIWGLCVSPKLFVNYYALYISTYAFHIGAALSAFMWAGYMNEYLKISKNSKKNIDIVRSCILIIQLGFLMQNVMFKNIFNINQNCEYLPTPLRNYSFYIQFSYYIFIMCYSFAALIKTRGSKNRIYISTAFFSAIPFLFGILQMLFPDAAFYSMGFMLICVAIYGFNVTSEREKFLIELHQKEKNKFASIADAISADYEGIYYVDLETNNYQIFINETFNENQDTKTLETTGDFFADRLLFIKKNVYKDDHQLIIKKLSKEFIKEELSFKKTYTFNIRMYINNKIRYYAVKCAKSKIPGEENKIIIGFYDVDDEIHEQQERNEIISAVGNAYESIYSVNTLDGSFETFRRSEYLSKNYNDGKSTFSESCSKYIQNDVHPDYKDLVKRCTDISFLRKQMKDKTRFDMSFIDIHTGLNQYYEMRVVKPKKYEENGKLLVGFINRTETVEQQKKDIYITSLSDDYDSVYIANLDENFIENIRITPEFKKNHEYLNQKLSLTEFIELCNKSIYKEDLDMFKQQLNISNIKTKLTEHKDFYINYRQDINGIIRYYRIKIIRTENWFSQKQFMIGTSNVDELVRTQIEQTNESKRKTDILEIMGDYYESICYVNLNDNSYIPYEAEKKFAQWYKGNSFSEDFANYIDSVVLEEYRGILKECMSTDTIKNLLSGEIINSENQINDNLLFSIQYQDNRTGSPKYYELTILKIDDSHIITTIQDRDYIIRKENEQKEILSEQKAKAEAANKAKSTFLFNMSHDIRTPMNAIKGFTELAEKNLDDKEKAANYLEKVKTSNEHLLHLINDVLDMSRIESGKVKIDSSPENIKTITEEMLEIIQFSASSKKINFNYELKNIKNYCIYADKLHFKQILLNILSNAVKYTKQGGSVDYCIEQIENNSKGTASFVCIVKDNGIGMSKEYLSHIYEEFSRASNSTKSGIEGTGLGMSIVKRLIDMMGGEIQIESELGKGTTVKTFFDFKICEQKNISESDAGLNETNHIFLKGKRVLIVEDNEFNMEIAHELLSDEKLIIEEADDGSVAVDKVKNHAPDYYDFILMDVQMPYMNGYQATKEIRSLKNDDYTKIPIIAMTANAFDEDKKNAFEAGMNGHLSKPIDIKLLVKTLTQFCAK